MKPPRGYWGGPAKFEADLQQLVEKKAEALIRLSRPDVHNPRIAVIARADVHFCLAYSHRWLGEPERAAGEFGAALGLANQYLEQEYDQPGNPQGLTGASQIGAIAAAFIGEDQESRRLFDLCQRAAAGLGAGMEEPANPAATLDRLAIYPLARAYSLLRLGHLSGFRATVYLQPWPEARHTEPVWTTAEIEALLRTAEVCLAQSKARRLGTFPAQRNLVPVLRSLARCLALPEDESLRQLAREALQAYYDKIRDTGEYQEIWPLYLDLQTAYPEIYPAL